MTGGKFVTLFSTLCDVWVASYVAQVTIASVLSRLQQWIGDWQIPH